jgi:TonB family protein
MLFPPLPIFLEGISPGEFMHRPAHRPSHLDLCPSFAHFLPALAIALLLCVGAPLHAQRAAVHKVPPTYLPIAKQMGVTGIIMVVTTVDASGKVIKAESSSANKLLVNAAIDAVKQWKFAPGDATETFPVAIDFEKQ